MVGVEAPTCSLFKHTYFLPVFLDVSFNKEEAADALHFYLKQPDVSTKTVIEKLLL